MGASCGSCGCESSLCPPCMSHPEKVVTLPHSSSSSTAAGFPALCLSMLQFMKLSRMKPHEDLLDKLVEPADDAIVHFISHEWLGFSHPDPDGTQLKRMQQIFNKFMEGSAQELFQDKDWQAFLQGVSAGTSKDVRDLEGLVVKHDNRTHSDLVQHVKGGCVWLDYHSIPQAVKDEQFLKAVQGIPYYVERCNYFWILAPRAVHSDLQEPRDFASWRRRGWCRLEETANFLSKSLKMPLIVSSQPQLLTFGFLDGLLLHFGRPERSVFNGDFTCCRFNHQAAQADGTYLKLPCDKESIGPILRQMFDVFLHGPPSKEQKFRKNMLRSAARSMFAGYPPEEHKWQPDPNENLDAFLARIDYTSLDETDGMGWTPLVWAWRMADMKVVRRMLQEKPELLHSRTAVGDVPIIHSLVFNQPERLRECLSMHDQNSLVAVVNDRPSSGRSALERAVKFGFHENAELLLAARADAEVPRKDNGATPLISAAQEGYPQCCEVLLKYRADVHAADSQGLTALHHAVHPLAVLGNSEANAKLQVIKCLLEGKASVNALDSCGRTPVQLARELDFTECLGLLSQ